MSKPFSILHISDLHRSTKDPITNAELMSALIGDRDRYICEDIKIPPPEAIIVSGDLIQGVPLNTMDFEKNLAEQYEVAEEFLGELVERFLDGNRSRIIIIPGNHDIDWNTAFKSMEKIDLTNLPKNFAQQLLSDKSRYRWDWKTLTPYHITDIDLYSRRLDFFWRFFEKFYSGVPELLNVNAGADANLFSLCEGQIGVAAFNSCHGNDCFAFHGRIPKEVVSKSHLDFLDGKHFDLLISVWHHNFEGPPYSTDYMDIDVVKSMIGCGFRLGLYGHQHKAQVAPHQIWLPDSERMGVVSAGSLCAGSEELPTGFTRQYNIIEIAEDFKSARVHVREMVTSNIFSRGRIIEYGGKSYADLDWELPKNSAGGFINNKINRIRISIEQAELALKTGEPDQAIKLLVDLDLAPGSYEKDLLLTASEVTKNWELIVEITNPPGTIKELTQLIDAYCKLGKFSSATESMETFAKQLNFPSALEKEIRKRITILNKIKK